MANKDKDKNRKYMNEYMTRRYHERRAAAVLQLGGKCSHCNSIENLNFDHVDSDTKRFDVAKLFASASNNKLKAELALCQLLCTDCHKNKTNLFRDVSHIGVLNPATKLTEVQVLEARHTFVSGSKTHGGRALARKYGVSHTTMMMILTGQTWKHL